MEVKVLDLYLSVGQGVFYTQFHTAKNYFALKKHGRDLFTGLFEVYMLCGKSHN